MVMEIYEFERSPTLSFRMNSLSITNVGYFIALIL